MSILACENDEARMSNDEGMLEAEARDGRWTGVSSFDHSSFLSHVLDDVVAGSAFSIALCLFRPTLSIIACLENDFTISGESRENRPLLIPAIMAV
jgi:hypothetical protein